MASPKIAPSLLHNFRRVLPLMGDRRVPLGLKVATAIAGLLIISPLDVFGDIPVLGLLDDAVLLTLLAMLFVMLATRAAQRVAPARVPPAQHGEPQQNGVIQLPRAHPVQKR